MDRKHYLITLVYCNILRNSDPTGDGHIGYGSDFFSVRMLAVKKCSLLDNDIDHNAKVD